jgi:hypothetical protein
MRSYGGKVMAEKSKGSICGAGAGRGGYNSSSISKT